jgi:hypothetical protein
VFNFAPDFATQFYAAVRRRDHLAVRAGLKDFILPEQELAELKSLVEKLPVAANTQQAAE